jgi:hypothetical protein
MKIQFSKIVLAAGFGLALAFTACSSDIDDDQNSPPPKTNTYFYSIYGISNQSFCDYMWDNTDENSLSDESLAAVEYTFQDVKDMWLQVKTISGTILESKNNYAESSLRNDLMVSGGLAPSQVDAFMGELNNRKNSLLFGYSKDARYCALAMYFEKE